MRMGEEILTQNHNNTLKPHFQSCNYIYFHEQYADIKTKPRVKRDSTPLVSLSVVLDIE